MNQEKLETKFLRQSQYFEFGNYVKELHGWFLATDIPYERKKRYVETLVGLYKQCVNNTLTADFIQEKLFTGEDNIMDAIYEHSSEYGDFMSERMSFQYTCIRIEEEKALG